MHGLYVLGSLEERQIWYDSAISRTDTVLMAMRLGKIPIRDLLATIYEVVTNHTSSGYVVSEPLLLAVGTRQTVSPSLEVTNEEWDILCMDCGSWEWIDGELEGSVDLNGEGRNLRNEFGGESGISTQQTKGNGCICADTGVLEQKSKVSKD